MYPDPIYLLFPDSHPLLLQYTPQTKTRLNNNKTSKQNNTHTHKPKQKKKIGEESYHGTMEALVRPDNSHSL